MVFDQSGHVYSFDQSDLGSVDPKLVTFFQGGKEVTSIGGNSQGHIEEAGRYLEDHPRTRKWLVTPMSVV